MSNKKTAEGVRKLLTLSFILQNMPDQHLVEDKVVLSLGMQEIAKYIGDAHGMGWGELVTAAFAEIRDVMAGNESAKDIATDAILKAMGRQG